MYGFLLLEHSYQGVPLKYLSMWSLFAPIERVLLCFLLTTQLRQRRSVSVTPCFSPDPTGWLRLYSVVAPSAGRRSRN